MFDSKNWYQIAETRELSTRRVVAKELEHNLHYLVLGHILSLPAAKNIYFQRSWKLILVLRLYTTNTKRKIQHFWNGARHGQLSGSLPRAASVYVVSVAAHKLYNSSTVNRK